MVTGLTEREFEVEARRKRELPLHRCYLCQREEGENSVVFCEDGKPRIGEPPLACYRVELGEGFEFRFLLCSECRVLLGLMKRGNIREK